MALSRFSPSRMWAWLTQYWLALFVAVGCFISGVLWVLHRNPPEPFIIDVVPFFIAVISMGVLSFAATSLYETLDFAVPTRRFTIYLTPEPMEQVRSLATLFFVSVVVGLFIWQLLRLARFRREIRLLLYGNFFVGLGFAFLLLLQGSLVKPELPYSLKYTCGIRVSDTVRIREEYSDSILPEHRGLAGIPALQGTSYFLSTDDGKTWDLFMSLSPSRGDCQRSGIHSEEFLWLWEGGLLFITHDGGRSWHVWNAHQLGGDFSRSSGSDMADSYIDSVRFTDETHGTMELAYFDHATQTRPRFTLVSTDGGLTWR